MDPQAAQRTDQPHDAAQLPAAAAAASKPGLEAVKNIVADEHGAAVVGDKIRKHPEERDEILAWLHHHRGNAFVQAVIKATGTPTHKPGDERALIDAHTHYFILDETALGKDLLSRLPGDSAFVARVINALDFNNKDDVAFAIAHHATDDQLRAIGAGGGQGLMLQLMNHLRDGVTTDSEAVEMERLIRLSSPDHERLLHGSKEAAKDPAIVAALKKQGASIQSISDAEGDYMYDEYSITIDEMPPKVTPESFQVELETQFNATVNDWLFNMIDVFSRITPGDASKPMNVGDLAKIDITGPDNGALVCLERNDRHIVFQTVISSQTGTHPEYGTRMFGWERADDGAVRFFTKGAFRNGSLTYRKASVVPQYLGFVGLLTGIGNTINDRGGKTRAGSFNSWTSRR